jgi:hypothetical protein
MSRTVAKSMNLDLGLTDDDVLDIRASSMAAHNDRRNA